MVRIPVLEPNIGQLEKEYVNRALNSGWIGGKGDFIDQFEDKFAKFIGVNHAITCSNGTAALCLAYHSIGIGEQTKVIVPDDTFIATYNQLRLFTHYFEQKPVDKDTWTLNINDRGEREVVVAVHLYGNPCDMGQVYKNKFVLVEDCAQALGSKYRNKRCGSFGVVSCFSFHSAKTITTGEGGMVCTNNDIIAKRVRHLRNQAMIEPYRHTGMGYNFRMTNIQAAMGCAQFERIHELLDAKIKIAKFYNENLSKNFERQKDQKHSFVVKWANAYKTDKRENVVRALTEGGVETRPGFKDNNVIVFPSSTKLTQQELEYVVRIANEAVSN